MKSLIVFNILILLFLVACTHRATMQPMCRHTSILCALTAGEKYPIRIVYGEAWFGEHAEAQAYIDGKWKRLKFNGDGIEIVEKNTDWIIVYKEHVTIEQALKWSTKRFKQLNRERL